MSDHAPTTAQEAAHRGHLLRQEGRAHLDGYEAIGRLLARAEALLAREEALAGAAAGFEPRKSNEDERDWHLVRSELTANARNRMPDLLARAHAAGLEGLEGETFEFIGDLREFVSLVEVAERATEKRLRHHEREMQHQVSVTSWAKAEYEQTMKGRL
jgi:hypothetical protein